MGARSLAILSAACAASLAAPCPAQELRSPATMFFIEVPLGARTPKDLAPNFGLELQGSRPHQAVRIDRRMLDLLPGLVGIEGTRVVAADRRQREACPNMCAPK